jgi:hypothetical protein
MVRLVLLVTLCCSLLGGCTKCETTVRYEVMRDINFPGTILIEYSTPEAVNKRVQMSPLEHYALLYLFSVETGKFNSTTADHSTNITKLKITAINDTNATVLFDSEARGGRERLQSNLWMQSYGYNFTLYIGYPTYKFLVYNTLREPVLVRYTSEAFADSALVVQAGGYGLLYTTQRRDSAIGGPIQSLDAAALQRAIPSLSVLNANGVVLGRLSSSSAWSETLYVPAFYQSNLFTSRSRFYVFNVRTNLD